MITHEELVKKGSKYLNKHVGNCIIPNCPVVVTELKTLQDEIPDIVGFTAHHCVLIEVKTSRQDFLQDKNKPFRQNPNAGVGTLRYYLSPEGIITPNDIQNTNWGLLIYKDNEITRTLDGKPFTSNTKKERSILYSLLRRK